MTIFLFQYGEKEITVDSSYLGGTINNPAMKGLKLARHAKLKNFSGYDPPFLRDINITSFRRVIERNKSTPLHSAQELLNFVDQCLSKNQRWHF